MDNVCCFTGHRKIVDDEEYLGELVVATVQRLIAGGVNIFVSGGALGFDTLCTKIIIEMKKTFPELRLELALPCVNQDRFWNDKQKKDYEYIKKNADSVSYSSEKYSPWCMHTRNRYMIDNSMYVIAYCNKEQGGSRYTLNYARKKDRKIFNLADVSKCDRIN